MSRERFQNFVQEAVLSLPQDLKAALRVVEDPEVDDDSRVLLAGTLIFVLSGSNAIPGCRGLLAMVDDVLLLRLALERVDKASPEAMKAHREDSPELFADFDEHIELIRDYLAEGLPVLEKALDKALTINHQGHRAKGCVQTTEGSDWLYDSVQEAILEQFEFDEDEVAREMKQVDRIIASLRTHS